MRDLFSGVKMLMWFLRARLAIADAIEHLWMFLWKSWNYLISRSLSDNDSTGCGSDFRCIAHRQLH